MKAGLDDPDQAESQRLADELSAWSHYFEPIGATRFHPGYSGADVGPLAENGVLALGLEMDETGYWPIHHTHADTIDKIDPQTLRRNVAALAMMTWLLADAPEVPRVKR